MFVPESIRSSRSAAVLTLVVAATLPMSPLDARAQHPPVLEGHVVDRASGAPVAGAHVRSEAGGRGTVTDAAGLFTLKGIHPGSQTIRVEAVGYWTQRTLVEARNGQVDPLNFALEPDPLVLAGMEAEGASRPGAMVLDREDLNAKGPSDLAGALQDLPGVVVTRQGGPGSPAAVSLRGSASNQVLVLLDGVPVNSPLTGGADLSAISLDGVERVTVLQGVQSARYGPRALGGVILVEGRVPVGHEARGRAFAGSWGSAAVTAAIGGSRAQSGGAEYSGRLGTEWRTTQGDFRYAVPDVRGGGEAARVNADARTLSLNGSASVRSGSRALTLIADLMDLERGMPGPVVAPSATSRQGQRRATLGATVGGGESVGWEVGVDAQRQSARFKDPSPPSAPPFDSQTLGRGLGARAGATKTVGHLDLEAGFEARYLDVTSSVLVPNRPAAQRTGGVWTSVSGRFPLSTTWTASVTGAVRADRHTSITGTEFSPRLAGSLSDGRWTLRTAVGSGFSPPSLADQFFQEGVMVQPNPDLGPERVRGEVEVGADVRIVAGSFATVDGTLDVYRANVDGMILWFPDFRFVWSPHNVSVHRWGWDLALAVGVRPGQSRLSASVSRASVTYAGPVLDGQVAYRPEWTGLAALDSSWSGWTGGLGVRYVGSRRTVPGSQANSLDAYWLADLRFGSEWTLSEWTLAPRVTVQNLFDVPAAMLPDYPFPGRSWGLEFTLNPAF